jgi:phosphate transport system protein
MERHFHQDLETLKAELLRMGGLAEAIVHKSVEALQRRDLKLAEEAIQDDRLIDRLEVDIDHHAIDLLARQQPMAVDLRFILAALKISNDLERVGDHAVNIAGSVLRLGTAPPVKPLIDIPRMAELALGMLKDALDAFVRKDSATAREILRRDDTVDELNRQVHRELIGYMVENPTIISRSLELILVARNLERVADLATNVAEELVFFTEARIVKHHLEETTS